jgi:hypothetical protein
MKHVGDRMQDLIRRKSTATLYHGDHGLLAALLRLCGCSVSFVSRWEFMLIDAISMIEFACQSLGHACFCLW